MSSAPISSTRDPLRDVVRPLAGAELDDAEARETVLVKRVFADDGFDLLPALADRQDDPARTVARFYDESGSSLQLHLAPGDRAVAAVGRDGHGIAGCDHVGKL